MPNKIFLSSCCATILALGIVLPTAPAYAGFQWVAPNENTALQPATADDFSASSSQDAVSEPEVVSPIIISGSPDSAQATTGSSASPAAPAFAAASSSVYPPPLPAASSYSPPPPAKQAVSAPPPSPVAPAISASSPPVAQPKADAKVDLSTATVNKTAVSKPAASSGTDVVQGFASQVPLAFALRQLLPAGYSFSADQGVDIDTLVSYKGGKSWGETLKTMLASAGLVSREQGTVVTISLIETRAAVTEKALPQLPQPSAKKPAITSSSAPTGRTDKPMVNVFPSDGWSAERGESLRKVLINWCSRAGVELKWLAEYDYPIEASAHFNGGFEDAVRNLLAGFDSARPQPIGELHNNSRAGQKVLVIQVRGNSYTN
jgi:hypothetical protein